MPEPAAQNDDVAGRANELFHHMVDSVGVKRFAGSMDLSTRQVNRMRSGAQPNPVERFVKALQSCEPELGDKVLDFVCQELGGYFVRESHSIDSAAASAVKECAEAIAAIADGHVSELDEVEIREAIASLISLSRHAKQNNGALPKQRPGA